MARALHAQVAALPIVAPHGHTDAGWFARDEAFGNPNDLLVVPDHYVTRMLHSQGVGLDEMGVPERDGSAVVQPRAAWRTFAANYALFRGTPSGLWLDHTFSEVFGLDVRLDAGTADHYYDTIAARLAEPAFRPRALFERFGIEVLATTDSPLDDLADHDRLVADGWGGPGGRVVTTFRPDPVVDPDFDGFPGNVARLGELTGEPTTTWAGYLDALRRRRADFRARGATATDHGHPSPATADLDPVTCQRLLDGALAGTLDAAGAERFRAQVLTEMAAMSLDDGMVLQIHPGSRRNHSPGLLRRFGRDRGADIPGPTDYVESLRPLLDRFGEEPDLRIILFTLDESAYTRELAPLAGYYPCITLGAPWWFLDSVEGMWRYRRAVIETAGFANTAGFNDDTRAFLSIPARHDVARRVDCGFLATLVTEHRLDLDDAHELAVDCAVNLAHRAYNL
ncbi:MAG: glucuronate isomerase [Actinomycetia bacterium]|nr:glucuronate isomerase [Actinomycetes bacterium]